MEAPVAVDPRLPEVLRFVVLLCPERWVGKVLYREPGLLVKGFSHCCWRRDVTLQRRWRELALYRSADFVFDFRPAFLTSA